MFGQGLRRQMAQIFSVHRGLLFVTASGRGTSSMGSVGGYLGVEVTLDHLLPVPLGTRVASRPGIPATCKDLDASPWPSSMWSIPATWPMTDADGLDIDRKKDVIETGGQNVYSKEASYALVPTPRWRRPPSSACLIRSTRSGPRGGRPQARPPRDDGNGHEAAGLGRQRAGRATPRLRRPSDQLPDAVATEHLRKQYVDVRRALHRMTAHRANREESPWLRFVPARRGPDRRQHRLLVEGRRGRTGPRRLHRRTAGKGRDRGNGSGPG